MSAFGGHEPWQYPECDTELDLAIIDEWAQTRREPEASCAGCGWTALLGDWPTSAPAGLVGAPAVTFHNWEMLRPEFVAEVIEHLGGGRCRYFWQRL